MFPIIKFAYNNSYQKTIKMALYEALYNKICRSPLYCDTIRERDTLIQILGPKKT